MQHMELPVRANEKKAPATNNCGHRSGNTYVLITPAYNEAALITQTIESVAAQTIMPLKWVIVDDGSTDGTADTIHRYAARFRFMEYVLPPHASIRRDILRQQRVRHSPRL
jgi:cellulose synthase/poly-beta-1,6-N-acetylglucosamine synthase-like glycosyltransferase